MVDHHENAGASITAPDMPSAYRDGHAKAALIDRALADRYVAATRLGDPEADAVVAELARHEPRLGQHWIKQGIEVGPSAITDAPDMVRAYFTDIERVPAWFDPDRVMPGCRAFHRHSEMFVGAFVAGVLIEGFATLISQSFCITGRLVDQGVRRLKQNNRQLVEIFLPGGLERHGDGWRLSARIRLIHARVRHLLAQAEEWDADAWGVPISTAHMAFATAVFSAHLLNRASMLGVRLSAEERASFMMIWRYAGHLMGVPDDILFKDEAEAGHLRAIGALCEPPPTMESILLTNALINSAPVVAGISEPAARRALAKKIYRISRAMIGDTLADQLRYPPMRTFGTLASLRLINGVEQVVGRVIPALAARRRAGQFQTMLLVSHHADDGIAYRLPGHVHAERDGQL